MLPCHRMVLALGCLSLLNACGQAAPSAACETRGAPDAYEPPCNPHVADSAYPTAHLNNYAQDSTPLRGPEPGQPIAVHNHPTYLVPIAAIFSPAYPDGSHAVWMPAISITQNSLLYKVDYRDGRIIDVYSRLLDEGSLPPYEDAISRVYGFLDRYSRMYRTSGQRLEVLGDALPGQLDSPIALQAIWQLPETALCRSTDYAVGMTMLYDGRAAVSTAQGMILVLPRGFSAERIETIDAPQLLHSINGSACGDASIADEALERISNNLASDETGAIYVTTDRAQYRFDASESQLKLRWRAVYQTGNGGGGARLDSGSGSSPTLMGTSHDRDRFVVITDGAPLMNLVLFWRDEIPVDWTPIAPGKDRRIACEYPVTFGDPARETSQSEQSVVVRGYAAFVPNNELRNAALLGLLPEFGSVQMGVAGLITQFPAFAPRGLERIDWDAQARSCRTHWVNREVSIPNAVPYLSIGSRLVYGLAQRNGIWGLEALDFDSGNSKLWIPAGVQPTANAFYSALTIGPDGDVWAGGINGYTIYRQAP